MNRETIWARIGLIINLDPNTGFRTKMDVDVNLDDVSFIDTISTLFKALII